MICAKVLFRCFKKDFTYRKLSCIEKRLDVAFSLKSDKVKLYSSLTSMCDICEPPNLNGMKKLDRNAFKKTVMVPCLIVDSVKANKALALVRKFLLKVMQVKGIEGIEDDKRRILINPDLVKSWHDLNENIREGLEKLNINESSFSKASLNLGYENWTAEALIRAVLPKDTVLRSYSLIGHIIHLNIKEELLDYKHVIAEILLDKVPMAKTVVCKKSFIDNVYRNFEMELLCGEPNFIASVCENNCRFELDFTKVYWNPRLSTEHFRIARSVNFGDVLFDVFAGVGPFAIPAAKKKCFVFANDLNPESIKWLEHNITLNKKSAEYIQCFNKDGGEFIQKDVKENLLKLWNDDCFIGKIHVVMNLPAIAPTFMKYFKGLLNRGDLLTVGVEKIKNCLPIINCYFFTHHEECEKAAFEQQSEMKLDNIEYRFQFVRKVSNSGSMFRITFSLPFDYLMEESEILECEEPLPKRICTE